MSPSGTKGESQQRAVVDAPPSELEVRPLATHAERDACVELQRRIWGTEYADTVPASILKVSQHVGGVAAGAFSRNTELVGFVYGLTGVRDGKLTHWSHMLGVLSAFRGQGIGRHLKLFQRHWLLDRGVMEMRWTFDPLVSGNAHFNLNLLGVRIHEYVADMYGDTGSGLHSFGTDRFVAHWDLEDPVPQDPGEQAEARHWDEAPLLNPNAGEGAPRAYLRDASPERVRIGIPYDILGLNRDAPSAAKAWRQTTRAAFRAAREEGYRIVGFRRSPEANRCHYLLLHPSSPGASSL